jgi:hypothetical protein
MGTWDKGKARFTCECGAVYECSYDDLPSREKGIFKCEVFGCGKVVHSWNGSRDYEDWTLVSPPPGPSGPKKRGDQASEL